MPDLDEYKTFRPRRKSLGWSQQKLADEAGVHRQTIVNIENGKVIPDIPTIEKISKTLEANEQQRSAA